MIAKVAGVVIDTGKVLVTLRAGLSAVFAKTCMVTVSVVAPALTT